jgi:hypothetical protein
MNGLSWPGVLYIVAAACRKVVAWVVQVHGSKGRNQRGGGSKHAGDGGIGCGRVAGLLGGDALRADEVSDRGQRGTVRVQRQLLK